jgi:polyhydroxyalkanoate synthesis regulator phasin
MNDLAVRLRTYRINKTPIEHKMNLFDAAATNIDELEAKVARLEARGIGDMQNRIDELEAEVSAPKGWWVTSNDLHIWQLEQQAKGIEDYADKARGLPAIWMKSRINELRNQARALKEQR